MHAPRPVSRVRRSLRSRLAGWSRLPTRGSDTAESFSALPAVRPPPVPINFMPASSRVPGSCSSPDGRRRSSRRVSRSAPIRRRPTSGGSLSRSIARAGVSSAPLAITGCRRPDRRNRPSSLHGVLYGVSNLVCPTPSTDQRLRDVLVSATLSPGRTSALTSIRADLSGSLLRLPHPRCQNGALTSTRNDRTTVATAPSRFATSLVVWRHQTTVIGDGTSLSASWRQPYQYEPKRVTSMPSTPRCRFVLRPRQFRRLRRKGSPYGLATFLNTRT